ncbi:uncharacterized protein LOC108677380 isoform X2 [Hyalella azteca]|uniref:Uncharacterized protein LOC108677380 isoform X2 n=1 Tax=Hyalella azteca TaxID=294128 RepID=A0A8B7P7G1_HYAAZ|nr:uncharacterized protein LOC108677380 isoform X2 [Hyalella azteca]
MPLMKQLLRALESHKRRELFSLNHCIMRHNPALKLWTPENIASSSYINYTAFKTDVRYLHSSSTINNASNFCINCTACRTDMRHFYAPPTVIASCSYNKYTADVRHLHVSSSLLISNDSKNRKRELLRATGSKTGSEKARAAAQSTEISLIGTEGLVTVMTLVEAERLAERRSLRLVRHADKELEAKGRRPVYKLITHKEYFEVTSAEKKRMAGSYIKGESRMELSYKISQNDLQSKIKTMIRNLNKGKQIKVNLSGSASSQKQMT